MRFSPKEATEDTATCKCCGTAKDHDLHLFECDALATVQAHHPRAMALFRRYSARRQRDAAAVDPYAPVITYGIVPRRLPPAGIGAALRAFVSVKDAYRRRWPIYVRLLADGAALVVDVFTDGSTFANDTPWARSGWGVHYPADEAADVSGKLEGTLQENNRAELTALVETLLLSLIHI